MARLRSLPPLIGTLPPTVAYLPRDARERERDRDAQAWRKWYKTKRWQVLRWSVLVRDMFACQWPGCGRVMADTSQLVADHKKAHRGDPGLFWDQGNLQTLCKPCHDSLKQREEAAGR